MPTERHCQKCGKLFVTKRARLAAGRGKFCSRSCAVSAQSTGRPNPHGKAALEKARQVKKETGLAPWNKKTPVTLTCFECGRLFDVIPSRATTARYCSHNCHSKSKTRVLGPSHPLYTRVERRCEWCGAARMVKPAKTQEFRFCSRSCLAAFVSSQKPIGTLERLLAEQFNARELDYVARHPIGSYCADFAFPGQRLVVEADGDYWHSTPTQKRKDAKRDAALSALGWQTLRLSESDILRNIEACVGQVIRLLSTLPTTNIDN